MRSGVVSILLAVCDSPIVLGHRTLSYAQRGVGFIFWLCPFAFPRGRWPRTRSGTNRHLVLVRLSRRPYGRRDRNRRHVRPSRWRHVDFRRPSQHARSIRTFFARCDRYARRLVLLDFQLLFLGWEYLASVPLFVCLGWRFALEASNVLPRRPT